MQRFALRKLTPSTRITSVSRRIVEAETPACSYEVLKGAIATRPCDAHEPAALVKPGYSRSSARVSGERGPPSWGSRSIVLA